MDELRKKLKTLMIRRLKGDVWPELPDKTFIDHYIDLNPEEKKLYRQIKNQQVDMLSEEINEKINFALPITVLSYGQSCCDTPALVDPEWVKPSTKMLELHELLSELVMVSKVVVFTKYARMCHILDEWLPWNSVSFTGELTHKERKRRQDDFLTNPETRVFIMDTAGAQAIDLHGKDVDGVWHQGAEYLVRYDSLWNPAMNSQVEDRIHRIGQKEKVTIVDFITRGTVEERVRKALVKKQSITQRIIEGQLTGEEWLDLM
jgi:SNF2 family DNA or RNA helicase